MSSARDTNPPTIEDFLRLLIDLVKGEFLDAADLRIVLTVQKSDRPNYPNDPAVNKVLRLVLEHFRDNQELSSKLEDDSLRQIYHVLSSYDWCDKGILKWHEVDKYLLYAIIAVTAIKLGGTVTEDKENGLPLIDNSGLQQGTFDCGFLANIFKTKTAPEVCSYLILEALKALQTYFMRTIDLRNGSSQWPGDSRKDLIRLIIALVRSHSKTELAAALGNYKWNTGRLSTLFAQQLGKSLSCTDISAETAKMLKLAVAAAAEADKISKGDAKTEVVVHDKKSDKKVEEAGVELGTISTAKSRKMQ